MAEVKIPTRPSSQVAEAFYDAETQTMRVVFKSKGAQYLYTNVDQETADSMEMEPWNDIKAGLFEYTRIA